VGRSRGWGGGGKGEKERTASKPNKFILNLYVFSSPPESSSPPSPPFLLYIHLYDVYKEKRKWGAKGKSTCFTSFSLDPLSCPPLSFLLWAPLPLISNIFYLYNKINYYLILLEINIYGKWVGRGAYIYIYIRSPPAKQLSLTYIFRSIKSNNIDFI